MPKRHLEGATQEARAKIRKELGTLKQLTVQPVTRERYKKAMEKFFEYLKAEKLVLPHKAHLLDPVVADYLEFLWAQGFGRAEASNVLAALQDSQPQLEGKLNESWRLLKAWTTNEVPNRAPPLPFDVLHAMIGHAIFHKRSAFALTLLLGYHGLLRTGEILAITPKHVTVSKPKGPAVISLGLTKAGKRQGAAESVTIYAEDSFRRLYQYVSQASSSRSSQPIAGPSHVWRKQFATTLSALSFSSWDFRPYSLRRGGATEAFRSHGNLDRLLLAGRWQSAKTARVYLNEGLAVLAELKLPWTAFASNLRAQYLQSLTRPLPTLEPRPSQAQVRGSWKNKNKARKKVAKNVKSKE